jgi:hypothetical protein
MNIIQRMQRKLGRSHEGSIMVEKINASKQNIRKLFEDT